MASGTFTAQNKVRPGAYINFKAVRKTASALSDRGVVAIPMALKWGPQGKVITVLSSDLTDGTSLAKVGFTAFDEEGLILRQALQNCHTALVYRIDSGGTQASATFSGITAKAKYAGTAGNNISVAIEKQGEKFAVITYYKGNMADEQIISALAELKVNQWVDFTIAENATLTATAAKALTGGTDGTVSADEYTAFFNAISVLNFNVLAVPDSDTALPPKVKDFIFDLRERQGKKVQAVVLDYPQADYEGIISVNQGYKTSSESVSPEAFTAYVAGITASAGVSASNTYREIEGAVDIINPLTDIEIEQALQNGQFVISRRCDNAIICEQDINTLKNFGSNKSRDYTKNRVIRTLDEIANTIGLNFQKNFVGKVDNTAAGRDAFKASVISLLNSLQEAGAITDFDSSTDVEISMGDAIDSVSAVLSVKPADAVEKLYMSVYVG